MKPIETFRERAEAAKEDRERYTVDNGQRHECPICKQVHYAKRVEKPEVQERK